MCVNFTRLGRNCVQITCNILLLITCNILGRNSSASELNRLKSHILSLNSLSETINRRRRGGNRIARRKSSFRSCHILKPQNTNPNRDSNRLCGIYGRHMLGKQTWPKASNATAKAPVLWGVWFVWTVLPWGHCQRTEPHTPDNDCSFHTVNWEIKGLSCQLGVDKIEDLRKGPSRLWYSVWPSLMPVITLRWSSEISRGPAFAVGLFARGVIPVISTLILQRLPCQSYLLFQHWYSKGYPVSHTCYFNTDTPKATQSVIPVISTLILQRLPCQSYLLFQHWYCKGYLSESYLYFITDTAKAILSVIHVISTLILQSLSCQALGIMGQRWDWFAWHQYTVTGWDRKFDHQLLRQRLQLSSRSIQGIH